MDALAELWVDNPDQRAAITESAATVDQLLRYDPEDRGESRDDNRRILFVPPLAIIYSVDLTHNVVRVLNVRLLSVRATGNNASNSRVELQMPR